MYKDWSGIHCCAKSKKSLEAATTIKEGSILKGYRSQLNIFQWLEKSEQQDQVVLGYLKHKINIHQDMDKNKVLNR